MSTCSTHGAEHNDILTPSQLVMDPSIFCSVAANIFPRSWTVKIKTSVLLQAVTLLMLVTLAFCTDILLLVTNL